MKGSSGGLGGEAIAAVAAFASPHRAPRRLPATRGVIHRHSPDDEDLIARFAQLFLFGDAIPVLRRAKPVP